MPPDIDAAAEMCVTAVFAASTTRYDKTLSEGQASDDRAWMMCSIGAMQLLRRPITDTEYHSSSSSAAGSMAGVAAAKPARALETLRQRFVPLPVCDGQTVRLTWRCLTATNRSEVSLKSQWSRMERLRACMGGRVTLMAPRRTICTQIIH